MWKAISLGEFFEIQRGHDLTSEERAPGNVPVYGAAGHNGFHNKSLAKAPGLVIGRSGGSFGKVHLVKEDYWPHNTALYVVDFRGNDPLFTYYLLRSLDFSSLNSGSAQPSLNRNFLYLQKVRVPSPDHQKKIGRILSLIDEKIELSNKINAELESLAKTIYDYWFVQFDFPDANGQPYKSSGGNMVYNEVLKREIPEGWEVKKLGELITSNRGVSYSGKDIVGEGVPMINLNCFNVDGTFKLNGVKTYSGNFNSSKILKPYDLVMCNTQQTALDPKKDIIAKCFLIPDIFNNEVVSSHHVTTISVKTEPLKFYLSKLFNSDYFHRYISGYATGTNILGLNFDGVLSYTSAIPGENVLLKYQQIALDVEKKKSLIIKENKELAALRDWLLPMLMNGQVTVKDAYEQVEGVLSMAAEG